MMRKTVAFSLGLLGLIGTAQAQFILAIDSGGDKVYKLSALDGSVVDANFIVDAGSAATYDFQTPKGISVTSNEIWISDQVSDAVFRFDHSGQYVGKISTTLDNVRGLNLVNGEMWVTNDGSANGGTVDTIYRYSLAGGLLGSFTTAGTSPFDVIQRGNEVLVTDSNTHDIDRYDFSGNFLGAFFSSPGGTGNMSFPQQMFLEGSDVFVAGFSPTTGLYRFNSAGSQTGNWAVSGALGLRGVTRLGNGNMLVTGGTRLVSLNLAGGDSDILNTAGLSFQYVTAFNPVPEPATLTALGLAFSGLLLRRRRSR